MLQMINAQLEEEEEDDGSLLFYHYLTFKGKKIIIIINEAVCLLHFLDCCLTALQPSESRAAAAQCVPSLCKKLQRGGPQSLGHPEASDPSAVSQRRCCWEPQPGCSGFIMV